MENDYTAAELAFLSAPTQLHPTLAERMRVVQMQRTGAQTTCGGPAPMTTPIAAQAAQPTSEAAKRAQERERLCARAYQRHQAEQAQKVTKESQK